MRRLSQALWGQWGGAPGVGGAGTQGAGSFRVGIGWRLGELVAKHWQPVAHLRESLQGREGLVLEGANPALDQPGAQGVDSLALVVGACGSGGERPSGAGGQRFGLVLWGAGSRGSAQCGWGRQAGAPPVVGACSRVITPLWP